MKMPFGTHRDKDLDSLPCSYLRWIDREVSAEVPLTVRPENREQYRLTRLQLLNETRRILRDRRLLGITIVDPNKPAVASRRRRSARRTG